MMSKTVFAFDLYGTLLSTDSIAEYLSAQHGIEQAEAVAATWRREQLQYTWRLNSMKQYENFEEVTKKSFLHALAEHDIQLGTQDIDSVLDAYDNLSAYEDVNSALRKFEATPNIGCVIFSNGTRKMIHNSIARSEGLASKASIFSQLISVDHIRSFKPAPEVYRYLKNCVEGSNSDSQLYLVSSNSFDIVGARAVGLPTVWVDRKGLGWNDKLGYKPNFVVGNLGDLIEAVEGG